MVQSFVTPGDEEVVDNEEDIVEIFLPHIRQFLMRIQMKA